MPHFTPLLQGRARTAGKSPVDSTSLNIQNNLQVSPTESTRTAGGRAGVGPSPGGCVVASVQAAQTSGTWLRCLRSSCGKSGGCPAPTLTAVFVLTWHHRWVLTCPRCQQPQYTDPVAAGLTRPACARSQLRGRLPGISGSVLLLNWALSVQRAAVTCGTGLWCQYEPSIVQLGTHNALGQLFIYKSTQRSPRPLHSTLSQNANWLLPVSQTGLLG